MKTRQASRPRGAHARVQHHAELGRARRCVRGAHISDGRDVLHFPPQEARTARGMQRTRRGGNDVEGITQARAWSVARTNITPSRIRPPSGAQARTRDRNGMAGRHRRTQVRLMPDVLLPSRSVPVNTPVLLECCVGVHGESAAGIQRERDTKLVRG
jgi:hypothetical protein